jgi:hypothetical protein
LCVIHTLRAAEANGGHLHLRALIAIQRRKYAHMVGELEEFCRKHDYRFSHESWGSESDSWLRAIEMLAGKPDVFGNEVHRGDLGYSSTQWWGRLVDNCLRWLRGRTPSAPTSSRRTRETDLDPVRRQGQRQGNRKE